MSFRFLNQLKYFCEGKRLTHVNEKNTKMVNINDKQMSLRYARAQCIVKTIKEVISLVKNNKKGDVIKTAEIAGIQASKKTSELIPLCHQVPLNTCEINITINENDNYFLVETYCEAFWKTGVEMEAMISCSIAANTLYDMCKSADKGIIISELKLIEKFGGKSGNYKI